MSKVVKLETIPKKEGQKPRVMSFPILAAEKILKKSKNWKVADKEKYVFSDGALIIKAKEEKE